MPGFQDTLDDILPPGEECDLGVEFGSRNGGRMLALPYGECPSFLME